jgi:hypothetical protein
MIKSKLLMDCRESKLILLKFEFPNISQIFILNFSKTVLFADVRRVLKILWNPPEDDETSTILHELGYDKLESVSHNN